MKTAIQTAASLAVSSFLFAEEPLPEITGLEKAATDFVSAYNQQDAGALSKLFTENGELTTLDGDELTTGRENIKTKYEILFSEENPSDISIEVDSVRLVAPGLAIEDGTAHFTQPGEPGESPRSVTYTAVLHQNDDGAWEIASSRSLKDVTDSAGQLADLARSLNGEWTCLTAQGVRLDLAIGWAASGKFLTGDMLVSSSDVEADKGNIRIAWDAAQKSIVSWMFDSEGGVTHGIWTPVEDGWVIRSDGSTADGEILMAQQKLTPLGDDSLTWEITNRLVDNEELPDTKLRLVRPAPTPSAK